MRPTPYLLPAPVGTTTGGVVPAPPVGCPPVGCPPQPSLQEVTVTMDDTVCVSVLGGPEEPDELGQGVVDTEVVGVVVGEQLPPDTGAVALYAELALLFDREGENSPSAQAASSRLDGGKRARIKRACRRDAALQDRREARLGIRLALASIVADGAVDLRTRADEARLGAFGDLGNDRAAVGSAARRGRGCRRAGCGRRR